MTTTSILVYSETPELALELVTCAGKIGGDNTSAAVLGSGDLSASVQKLSVNGISKIYTVSHDSLSAALPEPVVDALEKVSREASPQVILVSATKQGKEVAPRLATRLGFGCITDALNLKVNDGNTTAERLVWGGNAIASVSSKGPTVVTVPLRAFEKAHTSASPEIVSIQFEPKTPQKVRVVGKKEKPKGQVNIKDAEVVVSAGRGFKKKEDLAILDELASTLNAVLGASRPLASDLGWMPEDRQVGLSGVSVKPKLYVAVGISGQIQHLTGMRDSKVVVAINNDKNAPIFQECDYGIVGDLYTVVPELTKDLKRELGR